MSNKSILIIGKPSSGKTTYLAQFYSRLVKNKSAIKLYKSVEDIAPILDARERLSRAEETQPTSTEKYVELLLPIEVDGQKIDIKYPDSGGEQVSKIIEERNLDKHWTKALKESNTWVMFIRLSSLTAITDLSNQTLEKESLPNTNTKNLEEFEISDQSFFIELLQILLQIRGNNFHLKNNSVKLNIVLTCWDELANNDTPKAKLIRELPLLLNFIEANWEQQDFCVFGLSAQGFSLDNEAAKNKYLDEGPENFGFLITPDSKQTNDITMLMSEIL